MYSSPKEKSDIILSIFKDSRTIFRFKDISMLVGETDFQSLNKKLNYYVRADKLQNPRKGIYAKPGYNPEELACTIYVPSYLSLEYVLQKTGIVFQYDTQITSISYLSRNVAIENRTFVFRKLKGSALVNATGIKRLINQINIATAERAFLDLLYLEKDYYFDNLNSLNKPLVHKLLPLYQSKSLTLRASKLLQNV